MLAIIETGGKQYRVAEGDIIYVEKLNAAEGDDIKFDNVLAVFENEKVKLGTPFVKGVEVIGKVLKNGKNKKIVVFKFKAKKNYRKKTGHRQPYTKVQINTVAAAG
ncbi:MAG: 50S ribosomal protein L21 [Oscillospiraceae bacterium]|nr:50S ribosomal protein L21 [Oscillospiraceae bacterium]